MSTKRVKIREMKRKRKQQRTMLIIACVSAAVLAAVILGLVGLDSYSKSYIMTFEGKKINIADFRFCGIFAVSEETAKQDALDQLLYFLLIDKAARQNGLSLSDEEKADVLSEASYLKSSYGQYGIDLSFITDERMAELLGLNDLRHLLLDMYTADYIVDETDYQRRLADYIYNDRADYVDTQVKVIVSSSEEALADALLDLDMMDDPSDFDEVLIRYSEYYDEDSGIQLYPLKNLGFGDEINASIMAMEVGGISGILELNSGLFGILQVDSITVPTNEEIGVKFRDIYVNEKKEARFTEIVMDWKETANYTINQRAYEAA
jgi:hypothetical protein